MILSISPFRQSPKASKAFKKGGEMQGRRCTKTYASRFCDRSFGMHICEIREIEGKYCDKFLIQFRRERRHRHWKTCQFGHREKLKIELSSFYFFIYYYYYYFEKEKKKRENNPKIWGASVIIVNIFFERALEAGAVWIEMRLFDCLANYSRWI